jgi:DhnA family fructose-bisphosphate aldolase class Ia
MLFKKYSVTIPADVPRDMESTFISNYAKITKKTEHLLLFACDQKMEHLNNDFYGQGIHPDAMHVEHIFKIAHAGYVGALATHLGLIARYGKKYPHIPYIVKLNGKTDLIPAEHKDPYSPSLWSVADALALKHDHGISICGVGYTLYLGSTYEPEMLAQAARIVHDAHRNGLVAILWIYARGEHVKENHDPLLTAGITGIAATLGCDFVKIKAPVPEAVLGLAQSQAIAAAAAGNTKILYAGGPQTSTDQLFAHVHDSIVHGSVAGWAIGRNIFQHRLIDAIAITKGLHAILYEKKPVEYALKITQGATK